MIPEEMIYSVPESGNSLDNVIRRPRKVRASLEHDDGEISLRIARDTDFEVLHSAEESEGPAFDLKKKIQEWRAHARDYATGAGFRKAHRGRLDPRQFAIQLSQQAKLQADRYQSPYLARLAKRLRWVARQNTTSAAKLLERLADTDHETDGPRIEKPREVSRTAPVKSPQAPSPQKTTTQNLQGQPSNQQPQQDSWLPLQPDYTTVNPLALPLSPSIQPDHSWESERAGSRWADHNDDRDDLDDGDDRGSLNGDLVQNARDFLNQYRSINSLADDDFLAEQLTQPEVFESWMVNLDQQGIQADPSEMDAAWNQAISDMTERSDDDSSDQDQDLSPPLANRNSHVYEDQPQPFVAPGGDWANTIIRPEENPELDRYLSRQGYKYATSRYSVTQVVDQFLDHVAGEMVPGEVSPEHVQQFVESEYPDTSWKKVYAVIQKIADPGRRHERERTTDDDGEDSRQSSRRAYKSAGNSSRRVSAYMHTPFDETLQSSPYRRLQGQKEICAGCQGTGEGEMGSCTGCSGTGRELVNPHDPDLDYKDRVFQKTGSLLLVAVDRNSSGVSSVARQALNQLTGSRQASTGIEYHRHSPELMQLLRDYQVPYMTVSYQHPHYGCSRRARRQKSRSGTSESDTRAWMVDPAGKIYPCGRLHENCHEIHSEFQGQDTDQLLSRGWAKIGWFTTIIYLEAERLTDPFLRSLQDLTYRLNFKDNFQVQILMQNYEIMALKYSEFKRFESAQDVFRFYKKKYRYAAGNIKNRAWLLDPHGKLYNCGESHKFAYILHPEIFQKGDRLLQLVEKGWAKIGLIGGFLYGNIIHPTNTLIREMQTLADQAGFPDTGQVQLISGNYPDEDTIKVSYRDFKQFESAADVRRFQQYSYRSRGA